MFTIKVMNKLISLDLKNEKSFSNALKYKVDLDGEFKIRSEYICKTKENKTLIEHTEYYNLYELDNKYRYQVQKSGDDLLGTIEYRDNEVIIGLIERSYQTEYLLTQYAYVYIINKFGGILMHGSSLVYKDKGIIFTAPSGTGKSTHSRLWQKYSDAKVLNDDKNTLVVEDDKLMLYSSPWSGKHRLDNNIKSTLNAIVFLYQSKENKVERLKPISAMKYLLPQLLMPSKENKDYWNKVLDKIIELPLYRLGCNMEKEAFDVIKNELEVALCL